jgi:hypothetical protein
MSLNKKCIKDHCTIAGERFGSSQNYAEKIPEPPLYLEAPIDEQRKETSPGTIFEINRYSKHKKMLSSSHRARYYTLVSLLSPFKVLSRIRSKMDINTT